MMKGWIIDNNTILTIGVLKVMLKTKKEKKVFFIDI